MLKIFSKALTVSLLGLSLGAGIVSSAAAEDPVSLRLSMHQASNSPEKKRIIDPLVEFIESKSDGKIKVDVYANGTLHGAAEGFKALATDITDIAPTYPIYQSRSFNLNHVTNLPLAFQNAYVGVRVTEELYPEFLASEWERLGVYPLFYPVTATYDLITTKPVSSIEDIKGMKIRGGGAALNEIIERMGGTPVTIKSPEVYAAFQQGVVDGLLFNTASILSFRLDEIGKYYIPLGITRVGIAWGYSPKTFENLSPELKQIMFEAGREASILYADYVTEDTNAAIEAMKEKNITFVELPEEELQMVRDAIAPMWDKFVEENEAEGRPAQALVDALREKTEKYGAMTREEFVELQRTQPVEGLFPGK